ncbi:MAG: transcription antitermination factor NusB [Moraxella sp.]|nr:transcription antitermination factor NusB [Moraxella sp.]
MRKKNSVRAKVIATLEMVQLGHSLSGLLDELLKAVAPEDKGFAHELTLGTLRQWWAICRISESLVERDVSDKGVLAGINIGVYQLLYMSTPDYASIFATVEALKELDKDYGVGLTNAILRKVAKTPAKFAKKINKNHSLSNHLARQLKQDWVNDYEALGQILRSSAPLFVRANTAKISHDDYKALLVADGVQHDEVSLNSTVLGVKQCLRAFRIVGTLVQDLPRFADGFVAVQDIHAQLGVSLLDGLMKQKIAKNPSNEPVQLLDACTAPAGKLTQWLASLANVQQQFHVKPCYQLTAIDNEQTRLTRVFENLERLGFAEQLDKTLHVKIADATTFSPDCPFDIIMLDAPCTATGVIRRHPDIALLRQETDIAGTVQLQAEILDNLWQTLAVDGYLLYITCSILKVENETQITQFLARHANAVDVPIEADWGIAQAVGRQCLPISDGGDGFYYALLKKVG